jgi:hypothetical protein
MWMLHESRAFGNTLCTFIFVNFSKKTEIIPVGITKLLILIVLAQIIFPFVGNTFYIHYKFWA